LAPRRFFCPRIAVMPCLHGPSDVPQAMSSTSPWSKVIWYLGVGRSTGGMFKWWFTMVWLIIIRKYSKYEHEITWILEVSWSDNIRFSVIQFYSLWTRTYAAWACCWLRSNQTRIPEGLSYAVGHGKEAKTQHIIYII
jgi:hypothetical protein